MNTVIRTIRSHPWILPCIIAAVLVVGAAHMHELWGDEAETALFARNILKYGVPRGWDGDNIMGINNGVVLDKNLLNHTSPWAQYYMVAASFKLFGQSSFTARLPSIILYIISIPLMYYFVVFVTGKKRVGTLTALIAALSAQGILYGYQARYYELTSVAGLLFAWASVSLVDGAVMPSVVFVLSGILFYYANYVSWSAFYAATLVAVGGYVRMRKGGIAFKRFISRFFLLTIPIVLAALPWYILMQPFGDRGVITIYSISETLLWFRYLSLSAWGSFNTSGVFPVGLLAVLLVVIVRLRGKWERIRPLVVFGGIPGVFLIIMALYATLAYVDTIFSSPRYTTAAIPFFFIVVALLVDEILSWRRWVGVGLLVIYLATNLLTFGPPRSLLASLFYEIVHPYQTPEILVADFLKAHAAKGQTAFVNFDREHEPLIFLLGDHTLHFVNRVDLVNTHIFPKNRAIIPRYIYDFRDEPDWVILYSKRTPDGTLFTVDYKPLWPEVDLTHDYIEHVIPVFFADMSRPEIELRLFYPVANPAPTDYVYIYQKK